MNELNLPILRGYISYNRHDCCQIAIYCPYCRCNHYHGWPSRSLDPDRLEHCFSHCHGTRRRLAKDSPYKEKGYLIGIDPKRRHQPLR